MKCSSNIHNNLVEFNKLKFTNSYFQLGSAFYQRIAPSKVSKPRLLMFNNNLGESLSIPASLIKDNKRLAEYFSGNCLFKNSEPIALAYSGHQFGHFNPQLGDGRAHLLGELFDHENLRRDIQLKGSGQTMFSRRGDGKCALGPAIREYIMSEALYHLGVPTSRCLAVVATGETLYRGMAKEGAVVTRVASSHIRVGTFQYFAARRDITSLKKLTEYAINRHYIDIDKDLPLKEKTVLFLEKVIDKQIELIVQWMRVGFIHGVMNTDNTTISGETIDFGPCAMLGEYDHHAVFSSIDQQGRYAFGKQAEIAQWNMARLADCLLPLVDDDENIALAKIEPLIQQFTDKFEIAYFDMYAKKLGLTSENLQNKADYKVLINGFLTIMQNKSLDYTKTFFELTQSFGNPKINDKLRNTFGVCFEQWQKCLNDKGDIKKSIALMHQSNPVVIPRNHHVENILAGFECLEKNKIELVENKAEIECFLAVLSSPYTQLNNTEKYQDTPVDGDRYYQTFCGT